MKKEEESTWHYALAKRELGGLTLWGIVESYSNGGHSSESPIDWYDSKEEVIETLKMMLRDIQKHEVIDFKESYEHELGK